MRGSSFSFTHAELQGSATYAVTRPGSVDEPNRIRYEKAAMTIGPNLTPRLPLIRALEEIEKAGDEEAALHVRKALRALIASA